MQIEMPADAKHRMLGVVYTPIDIAKSIAKLSLSKCTNKVLNILEPSVGDGYFLVALQGYLTSEYNITGIDIDSDVIRGLGDRYDPPYQKKINLLNQDFIEYAISSKDEKFDLIIGNPPFIKKHNY
jgi:adenine-specific DNA-methyltransferase